MGYSRTHHRRGWLPRQRIQGLRAHVAGDGRGRGPASSRTTSLATRLTAVGSQPSLGFAYRKITRRALFQGATYWWRDSPNVRDSGGRSSLLARLIPV